MVSQNYVAKKYNAVNFFEADLEIITGF